MPVPALFRAISTAAHMSVSRRDAETELEVVARLSAQAAEAAKGNYGRHCIRRDVQSGDAFGHIALQRGREATE